MNESVFNFCVPINYLQFLLNYEMDLLDTVRSADPQVWSKTHGVSHKKQISYHLALISVYREHLNHLRTPKEVGFRASVKKRDQEYQFIAINCHLQEMMVSTSSAG